MKRLSEALKNLTTRTLNCMEKQTNKIVALMNLVGGVSGILALATMIFYGGALVEKIRGMDVRLTAVEINGSIQLQKHIVTDDQRTMDELQRLKEVEEAIKRMVNMESDIREIKVEVKYLSGRGNGLSK